MRAAQSVQVSSLPLWQSHRLLWIGLYLALITGLVFTVNLNRSYDDPYITYRYAQNLASGQGYVYNPGERIQSTTTPLFTLILALVAKVTPDLPHAANFLGALSIALGALCLWDLASSLRTPWVGWAALLLYPTFPMLSSTIGSETPLYVALILGALAAYARRRYRLTALLSALALLARPDGILLPVVLVVAFLVENLIQRIPPPPGTLRTLPEPLIDQVPWGALALFVILLLPWYTFAWIYFGSPLPVTLAAKQSQGSMAVSQRFAPYFLTILSWYKAWPFILLGGLFLLGLAYLIFYRPKLPARPRPSTLPPSRTRFWWILLAWTLLYFAAYSLLGVSQYFWYYAPLVPGVIAAAGLAIELFARLRLPSLPWPWMPGKLPLSGLLAGGLLLVVALGQLGQYLSMQNIVDERYALYKEAGLWLKANTPPAAEVGMLEVGIVGYYSERPIVGFAGLIQPVMATHLVHSTYEDAAAWALSQYRPEYVLLQAGLFPRLEQGYLAQNCQIVKSWRGADYGYPSDLNVYRCP